MEYFTNQSQWSHLQPNPGHSSSVENGQHSGQSHQQPTLDPTATYTYGDLSVPASAQPGQYWSPPPFNYYPFTNQNEYIPVTSYSSLNGATPISSSSQHQVAIDPSLTAPSDQLQSTNNASNYTDFSQSNHHQQEPILSINPSVLQNQPSHSSAIQSTPTSSASRPKVPLSDVLKPLLTATKLTGPSAVSVIVKLLESYGYQDIDCDDRTELFSKMSVQADDQFFRAWVENSMAMDITRTWLKAGASDKLDGPWRPSINPILSALNRMRFSIESLKNAKIGKIIVKLTKDTNSATRDLSQDLEAKWRRLLESAGPQGKSADSIDDSKVKKRKAPDGAPPKPIPPAKRPAVITSAPARPPAKREPKVIVTAVKDARSDSSFFSNKPKAKLPKFTKAPPPAAKPVTALAKATENIAQPSSFDPFQDALRQMKGRGSPKIDTRAGTPQTESKSTIQPRPNTTIKKKKSVTFAPDSQLEQIKYIEKVIYEDDLSIDTMHGMHSLRDLDRDEGAALHAHNIFEEQMDWADVLLVEASIEEKGSQSTEKVVQEEREKSALGAVYMFPSQVPESPSEPPQAPPDDPDSECKPMMLGDEIDGLTNEQPPSAANISDLLASLPSQMPGLPSGANQAMNASSTTQLTGNDINLLSSFLQTMQQQGSLGNLMQQFPANTSDTSAWESQQQQYFQAGNPHTMQWDSTDTGWGVGKGQHSGRGGYRGKRKPCKYFVQGLCRFGDNCDFSHDITS